MAALPILLNIFIQKDSMLIAPLYIKRNNSILSKMVIYDVTDAIANNSVLKNELKWNSKVLVIKLNKNYNYNNYDHNYSYDYDYNYNYGYNYNTDYNNNYDNKFIKELFESLDCKVFINIKDTDININAKTKTNANTEKDIENNEMEFLNRLLKFKNDDNILIAIGKQGNLEEAFEKLALNKKI